MARSRSGRETARELSGAFEAALGGTLRSVLLYGSVPRGEAIEGVSDVNVLVLLETVGAAELRTAAPLVRRWAAAGNTAPLLLSWQEWRRAADVFAIELADMRDAHEVLHGTDPLEGLQVVAQALRLQAERELRGKLLQLREGLMVTSEKPAETGQLLLRALPSFTTYLRAALRLAGRPVPTTTPEVIAEGAALVGGDGDALRRCWDARTAKRAPQAGLDDPLVQGYYRLAEQTAEFVDRLPEENAT